MKITKIIVLALSTILVTSCEKFTAHPYSHYIPGDKNLNERNIGEIESSCKDSDTLRFAVISDSHVEYDDLIDVVNAINNKNYDFVIHCGDQTDYGIVDEFLNTRDIMQKLRIPSIMILGNHDCLGSGKRTYKAIYGSTNFSFVADDVRFVCLNTNCVEYNNANNIPDFDFIEKEILANDNDMVVVAMHVEPWDDAFNNDKMNEFAYKIRDLSDYVICIYGHVHSIPSVIDSFGDGVIWYHCPKLSDRYYLSFMIYDKNVEYEAVMF